MSERQEKPETVSRKRALVSCDRCKIRRARCIRPSPDEPCSDCKISGVQCESKLPRKQRVYGSVETLSLRFRALESLVKGLFPAENVQDTNNLFKIAATRNIPMPATDDYTPAEIFNSPVQQQQQQPYPSPQTTAPPRSADGASPASTTNNHNPFLEIPPSQPVEKLIPTLHGVPHYFGPSSSFKLAITMGKLVARCNALPETRGILRYSSSSLSDQTNYQPNKASETSLKRMSTIQLHEDYPMPGFRNIPLGEEHRGIKRARTVPEGQTEDYTSKNPSHDTVADFLPARSVADALIAAYFEHVHFLLPLFHRSMFQMRYEQTWERKQVLRENEEIGWLCCLSLVFAFGAQALEKHDPERARNLQKKYLFFVRAQFGRLATTTSLVNVQALVLLQLYDHNAGKRSSAWILIGTAARMATSMGIHREGTNAEFNPIERNTRRLVWWSLYIFEKILCIILGRPSCIDDAEVSARVPDENMLENKEMPSDLMEKGYEIVKLSCQITRRSYWSEEFQGQCAPSITIAKELLKELDDWYGTLPHHLHIDSAVFPRQRRGILLLHVFYFYMRCIVTRSFLTQKVERNICRLEDKPFTPSDDLDQVLALAEDCIVSACKSIQCLNIVADMGFLNGVSWIDVLFVLHAVLIVCADFLARPKDQPESREDTQRKASVRAILHSVRAIKLAPTYNILSQIAFQFASITGASDEPYPPCKTPGESGILSPTPQPQPFTGHGLEQSLIDVSNSTHEWYESELANASWDFFDLATRNNASAMNSYFTTHPGGFVDPGAATGDVDDWAARTLRGMHGI